jgi:putative methyltransferase
VPRKVLISEPQAHEHEPYLPYMWAVLKSYCDRAEDFGSELEWLEPIYRKDSSAALLEPHRDEQPDVLGLSCYVWNWEVQCQIARDFKARHPECLVVAGGPHPDYKDPDFFKKHPYIDMVAVKDGEIAFSRILRKLLEGRSDYSDVPGLYLPGNGAGHVCTGPAQVPTRFDHSPYLDQEVFFAGVRERWGDARLNATWETNRGCPYSCSFCDWGSNTMSKVRLFDADRVKHEIEWFARMKVHAILLADANFGMPPRDLQIADWLNEAKAKYGYPRFVHYSPAKNNPERTIEIAKKFAVTGLSPVYTIAIQHTEPSVLAATDRSNISVDKQRTVARTVAGLNIPTLVQLILGIPGDDHELWRTCLTNLMEWGLHDNYQVFDYSLLPNAPAAAREYRERWQIDTVERWVPKMGTGHRRKRDFDALKLEIVVGSKTYSRADWVRMKTYTAFVRALHNCGLTRLVAMYLRFCHDVPYRAFYDEVIESHFGAQALARRLSEHFSAFLEHDDAVEDLELDQFPEHPMCFEPGRWLFFQLCLDFDAQFAGLKQFLLDRFPQASNLDSAIDYQRSVVVLPRADLGDGFSFETDRDWIAFSDTARRLTRYEPLPEPAPLAGARITVADDLAEFQSWPRDPTERWYRWIEYTREVGRTLSTTFQDLRR